MKCYMLDVWYADNEVCTMKFTTQQEQEDMFDLMRSGQIPVNLWAVEVINIKELS